MRLISRLLLIQIKNFSSFFFRCRMGVNKAGKLIKRGPVQVVLKEANEKRQLIVRSDDTLGRNSIEIYVKIIVILF